MEFRCRSPAESQSIFLRWWVRGGMENCAKADRGWSFETFACPVEHLLRFKLSKHEMISIQLRD